MKNNSKFFIFLLLSILPYNYSSLLLGKYQLVANILVYAIRLVLFIYVLYYMKHDSYDKNKSKMLKFVLLYFSFVFILNIFSTLTNNSFSIKELIIRCFSIIYMLTVYMYIIYNSKNKKEVIKDIKITCVILLILSIILYVYMPTIGKYYEGYGIYRFQGVAENRNSYIELMLPYIVSLLFLNDKGKLKIIDIVLLSMIIITIYMTRSATGIVTLVVYFALVLINKIIKKEVGIIKISIFICAIIWGYYFISTILGNEFLNSSIQFLNKTNTLTGRTYIWQKALHFIKSNPLIGYGYDNTIIGDSSNYLIGLKFPNDTHNSLLFMLLSSGIIGTIPLLAIIISFFKKSIKVVNNDKRYFYIVIYVISMVIRGLTESCWHYSHAVLFIFIILVYLKYSELNSGDSYEKKKSS